jgi:hypothetical protein
MQTRQPLLYRCQYCGEELSDPLPDTTTEEQARMALREVILWYQESPIREIQMADAACGRQFPLRAIEAALLSNGDRA